MRILLTGSAGFIASVVAGQLLDEGHEVVGLDNLNDAYDVRLKEWRLGQIEGRKNFAFVFCDISDFAQLEKSWERHGPFDAVVDLAARAGVRESLTNPWIYLSTNVNGTLNLLELARRCGTSKFVLASSSSVYGNSADLPYREDQRADRPLSPYAASKVAAEAIAHSYHCLYGLHVVVLRYFTVYGPAGRPDMSPFRFVRWISEGDPVRIYGDGHQSRDYTFVEDIARGTVAALDLSGFSVINLGSDAPVSLLEMARIVEKVVGARAQFVFEPRSGADVAKTWAAIEVARRTLGWAPRTDLRAGIESCVAWYRENRNWAKDLNL